MRETSKGADHSWGTCKTGLWQALMVGDTLGLGSSGREKVPGRGRRARLSATGGQRGRGTEKIIEVRRRRAKNPWGVGQEAAKQVT